MSAIRQFLKRVKMKGVVRPGAVRVTAMGRERLFRAFDVGRDTFIFEQGVSGHLNERPSVLIVEKEALRRRARGVVMTMSTGNHSVAAFPLLDGRFWKLSTLPSANRGEVLQRSIVCANAVNDTIEISQREISTPNLVKCDAWLLGDAGFGMRDVVMCERNETTLEHYRRRGQEWRVKPLAWTENEMRTALAAARKRMSTRLVYYHSARGVHFLSFQEFVRFSELAKTAPEDFIAGLKELVSVYEGNPCSFTRLPKHRGHHEIEFFGLRRGVALERLIPEIEKLMEAVALGRTGLLGVIQKTEMIVKTYRSLLTSPEMSDETSAKFVETMYMYITGEIYSVVGEGSTPAFDDRRTALPGATFEAGRPVMHPGADDRTEVLLSNLRGMMSKDEVVEYANVYELRTGADAPLGRGATREVVYKTNRRPLENSLIQKRMSRSAAGYSSYMLARIGALRSLGLSLSDFYLMLKRRPGTGRRQSDYYIRRRCEGEPMEAIPASYFRSALDSSVEDPEVVLALAALMGDAAAQNMAMKKFDPETQSPLYGVGKEIYEFEYDLIREQVVPKKVSTCSIRGSFGWPCLDYTDENLDRIAGFYFAHFAHALKAFHRAHPQTAMSDLAERFMGGFEFRTHAMEWQLSVMRDRFETFAPDLPPCYDFDRKWRFLMWALERQDRRLPILRRKFFEKVKVVEDEEVRNNPQ
ncbi:MAG: hypothetical protein J6T01_00800 [Kiritimatiellae bacterium]|nr:hypothetical protein [Kiritimatiellia bacterium]